MHYNIYENCASMIGFGLLSVVEVPINHMEVTWSMLLILSLGALAFLADSVQTSVAVLQRASDGHHMLGIGGRPGAFVVNEEAKYDQA